MNPGGNGPSQVAMATSGPRRDLIQDPNLIPGRFSVQQRPNYPPMQGNFTPDLLGKYPGMPMNQGLPMQI